MAAHLSIEESLAEVLAEHQWYDATTDNEDPATGCTGCDDWFGSEDAVDDGTFAAHQAAALAPVIAEAQAEALREAADKFQIGDWFNVIQGNAHVKIGNGQRVTDWLRSRADKLVTE